MTHPSQLVLKSGQPLQSLPQGALSIIPPGKTLKDTLLSFCAENLDVGRKLHIAEISPSGASKGRWGPPPSDVDAAAAPVQSALIGIVISSRIG